MNGVPRGFLGDRCASAHYRKHASQNYNTIWFLMREMLAETPYVFFNALVVTVIVSPNWAA